jgi:hypothetical protein
MPSLQGSRQNSLKNLETLPDDPRNKLIAPSPARNTKYEDFTYVATSQESLMPHKLNSVSPKVDTKIKS